MMGSRVTGWGYGLSSASMNLSGRSRSLATNAPLLAVLVLAVFLQLLYLLENTAPMHWDPSTHVGNSMMVARELAAAPVEGFYRAAVEDYRYYPPGFYLTTAPAFLLFGFRIQVGIAWQVLYLLATLLLIGKLTARYSSERWGALAALTYLCFPIVLGLGRMVWIENLLALQVVLVAWLLLENRTLDRLKGAALVGLVAGWGQLTKWQFAGCVAPMAAFLFLGRVEQLYCSRAGRRDWLRLAAWVGIAVSVFALVCVPWYAGHLQQVREDVRFNAYVNVMGNRPSHELSSMVYYLQSLPGQLIGLPLSALVLVGLVLTLVRPRHRDLLLLALSVVATVALMSIAPHKQGRFIMPLLPLLTVVAVAALPAWRRWARVATVAGLVGFGTVNAITQTFDLEEVVPRLSVPIGFDRSGFVVRYGSPEWILLPVQRESWRLDELFERISEDARRRGVEPTVTWILDRDHRYYNPATLQTYAEQYSVTITSVANADFRVFHGGPQSEFYRDGQRQAGRTLRELDRWALPDGSETRLYRCRPLSLAQESE